MRHRPSRNPSAAAATASLILIGGFLSSGSWAYRILEPLERAYEVTLEDLSFPHETPGELNLRECAVCPLISLRLTRDTTYFVDEVTMSWLEFSKTIDLIQEQSGGNDFTGVGIFVGIDSQLVTRVKIFLY